LFLLTHGFHTDIGMDII